MEFYWLQNSAMQWGVIHVLYFFFSYIGLELDVKDGATEIRKYFRFWRGQTKRLVFHFRQNENIVDVDTNSFSWIVCYTDFKPQHNTKLILNQTKHFFLVFSFYNSIRFPQIFSVVRVTRRNKRLAVDWQ